MDLYDVAIIGAGPGGLACAAKSQELGLSYILLEKGMKLFQGIIDAYPKGKRVYPTIPKGETGSFPIEDLEPSGSVEEYLANMEAFVERRRIAVQTDEEFQDLIRERGCFRVTTRKSSFKASNVILAFGSNIPADLGVYGEAKTVARNLNSPEEHIGAPTLVLGGGNAAADVVSSLSRAKRAAGDYTPIYWGHRAESFKVDKDVARDLGEEILLGGHIKILQGAVPKIGEVDEDGVERLLIQTQKIHLAHGVELQQGMSFPMKNVIACVGTQAPSVVFDRLGLQQITCTEGICKFGKEGARLLMLTPDFQTSTKGIYAIGGAISPAYLLIEEEGTLKEQKHSNLIFKAVQGGVCAVESIARRRS